METASVCDPTLTGEIPSPVETDTAHRELLASTADHLEENRRGWQDVIDHKLIEWGRDPERLEEDDLIPPSRCVIRLASQIAIALRDAGIAPPDWIVPNGDGGIVFERSMGLVAATVEIYEDGSVERALYDDCRLVSRERIL